MLDFPCPQCGEQENFWASYRPIGIWYVMCDECDWRGPECPSEDEAISAASVIKSKEAD